MKKYIDNLEEYIIAVLICGMVVLEAANALLHVVGAASVGLPQELAIYCYVWIAFLSGAFCAKKGCDVAVTMLSSKYSAGVQRVLGIAGGVINVLLSACLVVGAVAFVSRTAAAGEAGKLSQIPLVIVYAASVVGYALCLCRNVQSLLGAVKAPAAN